MRFHIDIPAFLKTKKRLITWSILSVILAFIYPFSLTCFIVVGFTLELLNPGIWVVAHYLWASSLGYAFSSLLINNKINLRNEIRLSVIVSWLFGLCITYLLEYYFLGNTNYHTRITMFEDSGFFISPIVGIFACLISYIILKSFIKRG